MLRSRSRGPLVAATALLAAYALPLFVPPAASAPAAPPPGADLLARLFPGVPAWWVGLRLVCLAAGAALAAAAAADVCLALPAPAAADRHIRASRARALAALALAAALVLAGLAADRFSRGAQVLYLALLAAPALLLLGVGAAGRDAAPEARLSMRLLPYAPIALWVAAGAFSWPHAPRSAEPVDTWLGFEWLLRAWRDGRNLLTQGFLPGINCVPMLLQGLPFFGRGGVAPSFGFVQAWHVLWVALAAAGTARLAALLVSPAAAAVACSAFLFSPFLLLFPLSPGAYFQGPLYTAGLLLLALAFRTGRSPAALAALGALAGIAAANPAITPLALLACAAAAWTCWRAPRFPTLAAATAALCFAAALLPALPDLESLRAMSEDYAQTGGEWAGLEAVLLGQRSPFDVPALWQAGRRGPFDVPLGALLSPFAAPRSPIRLWGDALYEPIGAALAALGLALALRHARDSAAARALLALLAASLLPGFVSSYDRASLTRAFCAPVPLAILAAAGFEALRRGIAPRLREDVVAACAAGAIAFGGLALYHALNPRILASSALALALGVHEDAPPGGLLLLEHPGPHDLSWLHVRLVTGAVPRRPLPVRAYTGPESLAATHEGSAPAAELLLWSPGLEADQRIAAAVCARWPGAALYTLVDRAGLSRLHAARPAGRGWEPALAASQWSVHGCAATARRPT